MLVEKWFLQVKFRFASSKDSEPQGREGYFLKINDNMPLFTSSIHEAKQFNNHHEAIDCMKELYDNHRDHFISITDSVMFKIGSNHVHVKDEDGEIKHS
jgi:hypothetical protein